MRDGYIGEPEKQIRTVTLKGKTGLASITLRGGQVVDVREPRVKSRLGRYLVGKNFITEKELQAALTAQKKKGKSTFLGEVLIEHAVLDRKTLEESMKDVVEDSLVHLLGWDEGLYRVEPSEDIPGNPVGSSPVKELAERASQMASAVEEEWIFDELLTDSREIEDDVKSEILQAVRRVSQKLRELKPKEIVLMVEDEALMREMFKDKLESFGFEVGKLPIVLADLIMPTISGKGIFGGLELLEEIQKTHSHVPVIVNTAYPDATIRRRALFLGATYYINKPERKDVAPDKLESQLNLFIEEMALCIQNVIQRHEIFFEREQQNILREELLSQLIQSREELQRVGELVQRDSGDIQFLKETSDRMVREKSLGKMAETIVQFAGREMDRGAIFLVRKEKVSGFYGQDRRPGHEDFSERVRGLNFMLDESSILKKAVSSGEVVMSENPGEDLGAGLLATLGDTPPQFTLALPLLVQNLVVAVLYGDVIPGGAPPRDIDSLEILLNLASMSLEIQQQQAIIQKIRQTKPGTKY
jgi:CheY-like chemotaxis protein